MKSTVRHEVIFQIIGHFGFILHAHQRFGPARIAATILDRRTL